MLKLNKSIVTGSLLFFAPVSVLALTNTSTSEQLEKDAVVKKADEADELITNRQLRASSGSLSRWSVNTYWSYSAGAINAPLDVVRPNITAAGDTGALQSLYADVGLRFRASAKDSLSLSMGLNMVSPFHFSIDSDNTALRNEYEQNARKLSANDPTLTFKHLDKFKGIQSVSSAAFSIYTSEFRRNAGFRTGILLAQNLMYEIGKSGLSLGAAVQGTINTFGGDVDSSKRPAFILGFYPAVEYVVSDRLNLRTVSGVWVNEFRRDASQFKRIVYQSVGVGISITRDIFLYPNIQFLPADIRSDKTNLGMSANINIF